MAIKPEVLDALLAAGATAEMIVAAVKADQVTDLVRLAQRRAERRALACSRALLGQVRRSWRKDRLGSAS